ncbi:MaoC/PaaZ C-terminal domain-containing protein [Nocardia sp. 348MFTsu5.1]|uniref:MaoC/PaaZ C-terminal domain-containing protein n=1 Tax=Nocardia sp. 348MFTsu5.1 TaxID=1172185 RepID=UPI00037C0C92|nr:MaoC/PaaZ C-terminal domain-containing protein [Nocardia sp. 348MFTsu5.1]
MTQNVTSAPDRDQPSAGDWAGIDLGSRAVTYRENDAILYALAVGARVSELALIDESQLRVLPTFALTLGQWAPDELGKLGGFDPTIALHGAQTLTVLRELPSAGTIEMSASVAAVWDKGSAAVFDIAVRSNYFTATWALFVPGAGGFGGERGPGRAVEPNFDDSEFRVSTWSEQAALYRLCGDMHRIHIDPVAAEKIGQPGPILHGLCTLGASVLAISRENAYAPWSLDQVSARFAGSVLPGDELAIRTSSHFDAIRFAVSTSRGAVLNDAVAHFSAGSERFAGA